jgi:hypothetical protein
MTDSGYVPTFPVGEPNTAYAENFVGQSFLTMLTTEGVTIGNVTFEPGLPQQLAHPPRLDNGGGDQILLCTAGIRLVPGRRRRPGQPGPGHRGPHSRPGSSTGTARRRTPGSPTSPWRSPRARHVCNEWLEPVTDEHYDHATHERRKVTIMTILQRELTP